ncbi:hypothetical protein ACZ90_06630 [Streptomyces albus subsp. albus]|nr:hypothetical protein ACZ90_06630 [Streptomyces albus subsp. albus]
MGVPPTPARYGGGLLADRYRLPQAPAEGYDQAEIRAFDTYSGQEVLLRRIPLPELVEAELVGDDPYQRDRPGRGGAARGGEDPAVRRAIDAATAAAALPDHPRLAQVFHVFAEAGSLWIVGESVAGRPLAALLAERPLSAHRAAEVAADVLTALRAVHAHGWVHRNVTARTVLICEDGRAMLTGLAAGAAEEALCGYDPLPAEPPAPLSPPPQASLPPARRSPDGPVDGPRPGGAGGGDGAGTSAGATRAYPAGTRSAVRADLAPRGGAGTPGAGVPEPRRSAEGAPAVGDGTPGEVPRAGGEPGAVGAAAPTPADGAGRGGPATVLAAERARQARILMVGAVTERWAPEQGGPVHANWRLAAPITPATDLWAVGALLFRAVQGHAPYPEEDTAELVRLVRSEPWALAEECGPLRPVVESLMRQDPAERPDVEELRGWLYALVRSAPEPDVGSRTVVVPSGGPGGGPGGAHDPRRLPVVRRRGWLVRRGRGRSGTPVAPDGGSGRGGPADPRVQRPPRERYQAREPRAPRPAREPRIPRGPREPRIGQRRGPRSLGRWLLVGILLLLVAAVLYAVLFMPKADRDADRGGGAPAVHTSAATQGETTGGGARHGGQDPEEGEDPNGAGDGAERGRGTGRAPQSTDPTGLPKGFVVRQDPAGFQVAVRESWTRRGANTRGQVRYLGGDFELLVVAGRDRVADAGADPMAYQQAKEPELAAFRASAWSSSSGLRRIDVGGTAMAEGAFRWRDGSGREVYARNLAMLLDGRYHIVQVIGPAGERRAVDRYYEQAAAGYTAAEG